MSTKDLFAPPPTDERPLELDTPYAERREADEHDGHDGHEEPESGTPPRRPGRPVGFTAKLFAVAVLVMVGVEVAATLIQHGSAARPGHWKDAAAKVKAERKPGEPVLFAPLWVEPLGRHHLGDQLDPELLMLSDVDSHQRVFEVSVRGKRHPWLVGQRPSQRWTLGRVTVALYERETPAEVLFDFTARIQDARVTLIQNASEASKDARVRRCRWKNGARGRRGRFTCDPRRGWNWVGPHLAEVAHRPYRCIFAHPVDEHVVRITFPAVKMGNTLVGYTGIDDFENRKRSDAPVVLKVFAGPKQIKVVHHQNAWPWRRFTVVTRAHAGQSLPVSFEVSTPAAFARTFCFAAQTRK